MSAIHVNDHTFDQSVLSDSGVVLVDFWAPWCGPCRAMSSIVDELAGELGDSAKVVKANVDESPNAAVQYGVNSIPAFVVLKNGEVQEQFAGVVTKQRLQEAVKSHAN